MFKSTEWDSKKKYRLRKKRTENEKNKIKHDIEIGCTGL